MQVDPNQIRRLIVLTIFLAFCTHTHGRADDTAPAEVLKGQGLKRSAGSSWVLPGEVAILKDARMARDLSVQLKRAQDQQQALEVGNQSPQIFIDNYRQQFEWLDQRISAYDQELANIGPAAGTQVANVYYNLLVLERNGLVTEQRRLSALIRNLADQRGHFQQLKRQFNSEVARLRESYMQAVSELRKSVDGITAKYAELNAKEIVSAALKDLSASSNSPQKLGPSKDLATAIKWLERSEGTVRNETIELHRENGVDHVDVMLNAKGPVRMVFDTGAGPTTLSAEVAEQLGLKPTGRTVECVVADGSKVMAKEMIIRTASLGRLSVKDVTCVVMPKEKGGVALLLGQSVLQRFDFKYIQGSGRLVLTKVEPDEPARPAKNVTTPARKRGTR